MKMPSQFEQEIAERYCLWRELERPDTTVKSCLLCALIFEAIATIFTSGIFLCLDWLGTFSFMKWLEFFISFKSAHPFSAFVLIWLAVNLLMFVICSKMIVIGAVRLYQHYAPEEIRRRCICMPSCSAYTIMAVRKYGVIVGGVMSYIRLFKHCRGNIYSIDYPFFKYGKHYSRRK